MDLVAVQDVGETALCARKSPAGYAGPATRQPASQSRHQKSQHQQIHAPRHEPEGEVVLQSRRRLLRCGTRHQRTTTTPNAKSITKKKQLPIPTMQVPQRLHTPSHEFTSGLYKCSNTSSRVNPLLRPAPPPRKRAISSSTSAVADCGNPRARMAKAPLLITASSTCCR